MAEAAGTSLATVRAHLLDVGRGTDYDLRWQLLWEALRDHRDEVEALLPELVRGEDENARWVGSSLVCIAAASADDGELEALGRRMLTAAFEHVQENDAACDLIQAAGHCRDHTKCDVLLGYVDDPDEDVREACAMALASLQGPDDSSAVHDALVVLAGDPVVDVRDWALFGIGRGRLDSVPLATPPAIAAYRAALDDEDEEVRVEAHAALALLGDVPALIWSLELEFGYVDCDWFPVIARLADPRLAQPLARWRERTGFDPADPRYVAAIDACRR